MDIATTRTFQGVCRCCFVSTAVCKSLLLPITINVKETYAEMLEKCLGINVQSGEDPLESKMEAGYYLICDDCIARLENCVEFKRLVTETFVLFDGIKKEQFSRPDTTIEFEFVKKKEDLDSANNFSPEHAFDESEFELINEKKPNSKKKSKLKVKRKSSSSVLIEGINTVHSDFDNVKDSIKPEYAGSNHRKKYIKKKPSGAQRAREILAMVDQEKLQCRICSQIFPNNYGLKVHMHEHFPDYICDVCGKGFAIKRQYQYHRRRHQTGAFVCPHCGETLPSRAKYDHHKFTHRAAHSYVCRRCGERFKSHYSREKHLRDEHKSEKKYRCDACTETFLVKATLDVHYRRVHAKRENKYACDACGRSFFDRTALTKHMIVHDGRRIHECVVCHKSYPRVRTLHEHMKIHNNVRNHMCNMCGKAFVQVATLRGHLRVHEKERLREMSKAELTF